MSEMLESINEDESLQSSPFSETFKTRLGSVDEGLRFEELMIANLCFDLIFNKEVKHFAVSSNVDGMGAFDDVVVELLDTNNKKQKIAMQLKYTRSDKRNLTMDSLLANRGDYSLKKYMTDYNKISRKEDRLTTILLVRRCFNADSKNGLIVQEVKNDFTFFKYDKCYRFRMESNNVQENQEYEKFFENFFLLTTQTSVQNIEDEIARKFGQRFFSGADSKPYIDFIKKWGYDTSSKKPKLDKSFLTKVISLQLLNPYIRTPSQGRI